MLSLLLVSAAALAVAIAYAAYRRASAPRRVRRLRREYLRRLQQPPGMAEETLARQLERIQRRCPGRSEAWYLRSLAEELRRDRR